MSDIVKRLRIRQPLLGKLCDEAADEIERLKAALRDSMCPGGGYTGQPKDESPTVGNCLKAGVCGCDTGAALEEKK